MEFEKRIEVRALLRAHTPTNRIAELVGCSERTVFNVKKAIEGGSDLRRKEHMHKEHSDRIIDDFLDALVSELSEDPMRSMRSIAREAGLSDFTIRMAVATFGLKSYVQRVRQMITPTIMANRVSRSKKTSLLAQAPVWLEHRGPEMWPPSSPDANPLDYGVWGVLKGKACRQHHATVDSLVHSMNEPWENMSADFIEKTCSRFRGRLEAIIEANGGHIED